MQREGSTLFIYLKVNLWKTKLFRVDELIVGSKTDKKTKDKSTFDNPLK